MEGEATVQGKLCLKGPKRKVGCWQQNTHGVRMLFQIASRIHERGWAHLDIRLPNIIEAQKKIYLIDSEYACRIGDSYPSYQLKIEDLYKTDIVRAENDMYLIGALASKLNVFPKLSVILMSKDFSARIKAFATLLS